MKSKKKSSFLSSLWRIAKPVATLGISVLVASLSKKTGSFQEVTNVVGNGLGAEVIEQIDEAVESADSARSKKRKEKRDASPEVEVKNN